VGACTKTPSILWAHISADDDVPMLSELRATVTSLTHPELEPVVQHEALVMGDSGAPPAPFSFPVIMPITLHADYVGDVLLVAEGLENEVVLASGTKETSLPAAKEMHATVTLSLVGSGPGTGEPVGGAGGSGGSGVP
jgi:hypothetical protein